jgi:hypothetical protein
MEVTGLIFIAFGFVALIFDLLTNRIPAKWAPILTSLPGAIGMILILGTTGILFTAFMVIGVGIWLWVEGLYEKLNHTEIDRFKSFTSRLGVFFISISIFAVFFFLLYPSTSIFISHLYKLLLTPRLIGVVTAFVVVYCATVFLFGAIYATLHLKFSNAGFQSRTPLRLRDFFLYSAFNMATQGYKDVMPEHWIIASLSIIQIFVGIILLGVYLAGAFTFVVQSPASP